MSRWMGLLCMCISTLLLLKRKPEHFLCNGSLFCFNFPCSHTCSVRRFSVHQQLLLEASQLSLYCRSGDISHSSLMQHKRNMKGFSSSQFMATLQVIKGSWLSVGVWGHSHLNHLIGIQEDKVHCVEIIADGLSWWIIFFYITVYSNVKITVFVIFKKKANVPR